MSTVLEERRTAVQAGPGPRHTRKPLRRGESRLHPVTWIFVLSVMAFSLVPFYWLINTSLKAGESLGAGELFPASPPWTTTSWCSGIRTFSWPSGTRLSSPW